MTPPVVTCGFYLTQDPYHVQDPLFDPFGKDATPFPPPEDILHIDPVALDTNLVNVDLWYKIEVHMWVVGYLPLLLEVSQIKLFKQKGDEALGVTLDIHSNELEVSQMGQANSTAIIFPLRALGDVEQVRLYVAPRRQVSISRVSSTFLCSTSVLSTCFQSLNSHSSCVTLKTEGKESNKSSKNIFKSQKSSSKGKGSKNLESGSIICDEEPAVIMRIYDITITSTNGAGNEGKATCSIIVMPEQHGSCKLCHNRDDLRQVFDDSNCWCPIQGRLPVPRYPRLGIRE